MIEQRDHEVVPRRGTGRVDERNAGDVRDEARAVVRVQRAVGRQQRLEARIGEVPDAAESIERHVVTEDQVAACVAIDAIGAGPSDEDVVLAASLDLVGTAVLPIHRIDAANHARERCRRYPDQPGIVTDHDVVAGVAAEVLGGRGRGVVATPEDDVAAGVASDPIVGPDGRCLQIALHAVVADEAVDLVEHQAGVAHDAIGDVAGATAAEAGDEVARGIGVLDPAEVTEQEVAAGPAVDRVAAETAEHDDRQRGRRQRDRAVGVDCVVAGLRVEHEEAVCGGVERHVDGVVAGAGVERRHRAQAGAIRVGGGRPVVGAVDRDRVAATPGPDRDAAGEVAAGIAHLAVGAGTRSAPATGP